MEANGGGMEPRGHVPKLATKLRISYPLGRGGAAVKLKDSHVTILISKLLKLLRTPELSKAL